MQAHRSHLYQRLVSAGWRTCDGRARSICVLGAISAITAAAGLVVDAAPARALRRQPRRLPRPLSCRVTFHVERRGAHASVAPATRERPEPMRNRYILAADTAAIALSVVGAFVLRLDWFFAQSPEHTLPFLFCLAAAIVVKPPVFYGFGLYRRYWRYAGVRDLLLVVLAESAASASGRRRGVDRVAAGRRPVLPAIHPGHRLAAGDRLPARHPPLGSPRSPNSRGQARRTAGASGKRVLVAGAGDAGALVVREMQKNPQLGHASRSGSSTISPSKLGKRIYGVPVVGHARRISAASSTVTHRRGRHRDADSAGRGRPQSARCVPAAPAVESRAVPGMFELLDGGSTSCRGCARSTSPTCCAGRQVRPRPEAGLYLQGQVVLVTGAGGSIGSELCRQVAQARAARLVLVGHGENSIFDVANQLRDAHPQVPVPPGDRRRPRRRPAARDLRRRASGLRRLPRRRAQARAAHGGAPARRRSATTCSARATSSTPRSRPASSASS